MSDPSAKTQTNPHPVSGHRTPREIAQDEAGPIGQPDLDVISKAASHENATRHPAPGSLPTSGNSKRSGKRR